MPLLANKIYILNKIKKDKKEDESVLCHPLTNEICSDNEELARKTFLYNQSIWTCKITGQINLTFKEAQKSELGGSKALKNSFMKCYEPTVLKYVHHSRESLESIIHKGWTQIHEEYSMNEAVTIKLTTPKQLLLKGFVVKIDRCPQKADDDIEILSIKLNPDASNSDKENIKKKTIPIKKNYHYSVKLLDMEKVVNDIPAETIERTSRPPSKDQIRMFIRAHAVRYAGKAVNPWIVDEDLVKKYKLPNTETEFICDKAKIKEMSRTTEMQIYKKLMEDAQKNGGDTVDLTISDEDDDKKPQKNLDTSASKKMKQITLIDMHSSAIAKPPPKIKSPFASPSRSMPPLAQQLLRLMKENKDDSMVNQLVLKCCQYTDSQIAKFPELIRDVIKDKKEKLEFKRKLKNMTPEEREAFMAKRREEQRNLQREKKKTEGKLDDADMVLSGTIIEGRLLTVDPALSHNQWARIASLSEFVRCFKGLLGPVTHEGFGDIGVEDLIRVVIGTNDSDKALFAEVVCLFLKTLLQDSKLKQRNELGVSVGEMPVTPCTATELLKIVLPWNDDDILDAERVEVDGEGDHNTAPVSRGRTKRSANHAHNDAIADPICEKLAHAEFDVLSAEEKIAVLELLQEKILELEIIGSFIEECQRESSEAYKKRLLDTKDLADRLKEIRTEMGLMTKLITEANEAIAATGNVEEAKVDEDMPSFARRRLSLEIKNKEQEERDKRMDMERQMQRMEKDEANCKRMIDVANQAYVTATTEVKQLMRLQPLGSDRYYRRYWVFPTAPVSLYIEYEDGGAHGECMSSEWRVMTTVDEVEQLIKGLDERGVRECSLKKELQAALPKLREQMEVITKKACEAPETIASEDNVKAADEENIESFLVTGFKDELRETEINIRQGSLGGVEDFDEWDRRLTESSDLGSMKEALVAVFLGVHERFWNAPMKSSSARSDFLAAVTDAQTQSRLNILQCFLDVCVCWTKSASDDKCRVCHKSNKEDSMLLCDACNRAYHLFCLRPPLKRVPAGEWLCPDCKSSTVSGNTRTQTNAHCCEEEASVEDEGEASEDEEEQEEVVEVCCVCQTAEEGLGKCVSCHSLYHAECHEPALRHMPRTGWYCSSCRHGDDKAKGAHKGRSQKATLVDSSEEEEEEEKAPVKVVKKPMNGVSKRKNNREEDKNGVTRKKSRRGQVVEEEEDDEPEEKNGRGGVTRRGSRRGVTNHEDEKRGRQGVTRKSSRRGVIHTTDDESQDEEEEEEDSHPRKVGSRKRGSVVPESQAVTKRVKTAAAEVAEHTGKCIKTLIKQLTNHKCAWPFMEAVDESEVPDYYNIVTTPMDLGVLADKHKVGHYSGSGGLKTFLGDVAQIFTNAELYNEEDTEIMGLAVDLEKYFVSAYDKCGLGLEYVRHSK